MKVYVVENESGTHILKGNKIPQGGVALTDMALLGKKVRVIQENVEGQLVKRVVLDTAAQAVVEAAKSVATDISNAYQTMSDEVDAQMYAVFRTLKPEYASAEYETWRDMVARPDAYAGIGLKVDHQLNAADTTELFSAGSALDTAVKITNYATRKIQLAEVYGVYRVQRIQQFKDERAVLLGS